MAKGPPDLAKMDTEDRIRTRAYFKWLARPVTHPPSELDDWLTAESEELALDLVAAVSEMPLPVPSFSQDDLWYEGDKIAKLVGLLAPSLRKRRARSHLLSLITEYQDYLTSSAPLGDDEAVRQGTNALHIVRLIASLKELVGSDFMQTATHTFRKELKDLFAEDPTAFDTAEFNLYSAAAIQRQTGFPVSFIGEGEESSPDLKVDNIAYVECKDIHTLNRANIEKALADNLDKAHDQLAAAQGRRRLAGTGICIDVPFGTLPLSPAEWDVIRRALCGTDAPQFVLVSSSGINSTTEVVGFPVYVCLVWSESGVPLFEIFLRRLTRVSHRIQPDGFDQILH